MPSPSRRSSGTSVASPPSALIVVVEFFEPADGARDGDDMRAAPRRFERRLIANAARRPGDEDDLAVQIGHGI